MQGFIILHNMFEQTGNFVLDAKIDAAGDSSDRVTDRVASHVPGGGSRWQISKTGVDLAAKNAINFEIAKVKGSIFKGNAEEEFSDDVWQSQYCR